MLAWIAIGLVAYAAAVLFIARCMAFGMGTLESKKQVVLDVFDGKRI